MCCRRAHDLLLRARYAELTEGQMDIYDWTVAASFAGIALSAIFSW